MSSIISTNAYGDLQLNGYAWRWLVDSNQPSASFGFTFSTNKGHYTFIPDDYISKGLVVGGNQYYHKGFLNKSTLESLYTQYQPIDFGGFRDVNRADDFYNMLEQNGFGTSGVLVPESWTVDNFHKAGSLGTNYYQIGRRVGNVTLGAIQGLGEKDGQMVYVPTASGASQASAWITGGATNNLIAQYQPRLKWYQKLAREISKVPLLPELAALGAAMIPGGAAYAPYVYAGLKGAALGAQGVDPLKAGLMVGVNLAGQNLLGNTALAKNIGASFGATTEAAQLAVGRVVLGAGVSGVRAGVTGGDVGKAMLSGAVAGGTTTAASFVSDALGKNADGFLKSITDNTNLTRIQAQEIIAASVVSGLVAETRGGDFGSVFASNLVNAGVTQSTANAMRDKLPETMTPEMRAAVTRGVSTVAGTAAEAIARGQDVDAYLAANLPTILQGALQMYAAEQAAIKEGWESLAEKQKYQAMFGENVKPDIALVKALDPNFDIEAYKKLNNIDTNEQAIEDFLSSGMLLGKPTSFEAFALRELSTLPEFDRDFYAEEFAEAITAAKTSTNPQQAIQSIADQINRSYTTPEEAAQFFRDTFGRPPESENDLAFVRQYTSIPETQAKQVFERSKSVTDDAERQRLQTIANTRNSLEEILRSEGYTNDDIAQLYDEGVYDQLVGALLQQQDQNIQELGRRADALAATFGADSPEAKAAFRDLLQAQHEVGGYGVSKDGENFVVAGGGDTWKPGLIVRPDGSVVDLEQRGVDIDGIYTYADGTTYSFGDAGDRAIVSALAIGQSPNPPADGGRSLFGTGTGSGEGPQFGFSFVGIDQKTGGSVFDNENSGFSLIAYSDGKALAVNKQDPTQVIWVSPEVAKDVIQSQPVKTPEQIKEEFKEIERQKADEAKVTPDEVKKAFDALGYKDPDDDVIASIIGGSQNQTQALEAIAKHASENMVSQDEARAVLESLGIRNPAQEDIDRLTGQYAKTELPARAQEVLPDARYNATNAALDQMATDLGTTREDLLAQLGMSESSIRDALAAAQEQTQQQIGGLEATVQAQYASLTAEQKALADALAQQGMELSEAIGVASQQASDALAGTEDRLTGQIGDLNTAFEARVAELMQQGQSQYEATQNALNDINNLLGAPGGEGQDPTGLYGDIAGVRSDLADQIGGLGTALEGQLAGLGEQMGAQAAAQRRQSQRFQAQNILGGLMQQLPQAAQPVSTPLYSESQYVDLSAPLQISPAQRHSMFDPARQNQQGPTKMASGGFLNGQGDPDTWDDILRMLGK